MSTKEVGDIQTTTKSGNLMTIGSTLMMIVSAAMMRI